MKDREFLWWIHNRLITVHGENENYDYMHKFRSVIWTVPAEQKTPNVSGLEARPMKSNLALFLRRKSDGKFYRGARFWRWTKSWRRASALPENFWKAMVLPRLLWEKSLGSHELLTLDEILSAEADRP